MTEHTRETLKWFVFFVTICVVISVVLAWAGVRVWHSGYDKGFSDGFGCGIQRGLAKREEDSAKTDTGLLYVWRCDLETGETIDHRTAYVVSADTFGPFGKRYLVLGEDEITEETIGGRGLLEMYGIPGKPIDRVSVTDKEVLVFYRDANK